MCLLFISEQHIKVMLQSFKVYLLLKVYGLLFTYVSILHENIADPVFKKKKSKIIYYIDFIFLLCNRCPTSFDEIEGNVVSSHCRQFEVNICKSIRFMVIINEMGSSISATNVLNVLWVYA